MPDDAPQPTPPGVCSSATNCLTHAVDPDGTVWLSSTRRPDVRLRVDPDEWASRPATLGGLGELADGRHELGVLRGIATDLEQRLDLALTDCARALAERDEARHELIEFRERHVLTHAKMDQLRYERHLLGHARRLLDQIANSDYDVYPAEQAADIAQRIMDEIGHPVTDEPALGPTYREQIAALTAERDRRGDELRRAQGVIEAAKAWRAARPGRWVAGPDVEFHLLDAVDALDHGEAGRDG